VTWTGANSADAWVKGGIEGTHSLSHVIRFGFPSVPITIAADIADFHDRVKTLEGSFCKNMK